MIIKNLEHLKYENPGHLNMGDILVALLSIGNPDHYCIYMYVNPGH